MSQHLYDTAEMILCSGLEWARYTHDRRALDEPSSEWTAAELLLQACERPGETAGAQLTSGLFIMIRAGRFDDAEREYELHAGAWAESDAAMTDDLRSSAALLLAESWRREQDDLALAV